MNSKTIAQQLVELRGLAAAQLATRYSELFGKPPRVRNRAWLFRQVAFRLQEQQLGGLSDRAKTRLGELMAQSDLPIATTPTPRPKPKPVARAESTAPTVGTVLVREWHGQRIEVRVIADGFTWNGVTYTSLSAVAKAITGVGWSGALFFGLRKRRPAS